MIINREVEESYIIDFCDYEYYDDFDQIISHLEKKFQLNIIEKIDGPESRLWYLELDGIALTLRNNPYGNYIKSESNKSIDFLKENFDTIRAIFL